MKTSLALLFFSLFLGVSNAFVTPSVINHQHNRVTTTAVYVEPVNGGVKGSDLVCGQYETVGLVFDKKDASQGGLKRKPTKRRSLLPKVPKATKGELAMMTGGVNASTKLADRAAPKP